MKKGFLLFEVLISILIASLVILAVMHGMRTSLKALAVADMYGNVVLISDNQLQLMELDDTFKTGESSGKFDNNQDPQSLFTWTKNIKKYTVATDYGIVEYPLYDVTYTIESKNAVRRTRYTTLYLNNNEITNE